ncbi:GNAT family N-acetyltransferase [Sphingomonas prati]|uniref:GNAT superfamily N-acetyltransferase n=1 Tax=Sphingomonas prati TaxID=1843237 RepID=A0A7W9BV06_9SPHN|nr:GNAT family N-acetyltransferase [Sphingomonas prati]MBB5730633.1 GNAT superfamily N-acetyltransferase [Sphingomonas prati]GGE96410.1 N-acetyltransferase [Sphingomonas prati]
MTHRIVTPDTPTDADRDAILAPLRAYNAAHAPATQHLPVALVVTDEQGETIGGLWGKTGYDWLFVEYLVVPDALRGQGVGTELMQQAEAIARDRGCIGVWLDTFDFQARGFYEKLGYTVFGTIADHPIGGARHFLMKRLSD